MQKPCTDLQNTSQHFNMNNLQPACSTVSENDALDVRTNLHLEYQCLRMRPLTTFN